jgi:hypothetical protein
MPDDERRNARFRRYRLNPALNATAVALKIILAIHTSHCSPVRPKTGHLNDTSGVEPLVGKTRRFTRFDRWSMSAIEIFRQLRRWLGGLDYFRLADDPLTVLVYTLVRL